MKISKSIVAMILAGAMSTALLAGCGKSGTAVMDGDENGVFSSSNSDGASFDASTVASKITTTEYTYEATTFKGYAVVLKNESGFDCDLTVKVDFLDKDGKVVDDSIDEINAFAKDTEVALDFIAEGDFETAKLTLEAEELTLYSTITQDLEAKASKKDDEHIEVSVTNNSNKAAKFAEYTALLFKDGKLSTVESGYITDDDYEIKPGATQTKETSVYYEFDEIKVYADAYSDK